MRCEVKALDFWDLTPRETYATIEAWLWRSEQHQRQQIALAWRTAALTRAKKLPTLAELLNKPAKALVGAELTKRRAEWRSMTRNVNLSALNNRVTPKAHN